MSTVYTPAALKEQLEQLAVCLDDWARKARAEALWEEEANHEHFADACRQAAIAIEAESRPANAQDHRGVVAEQADRVGKEDVCPATHREPDELLALALKRLEQATDDRLSSTDRYTAEKELTRILHRLHEAATPSGKGLTTEQERELFEAWARSRDWPFNDVPQGEAGHIAWEAWQARAALSQPAQAEGRVPLTEAEINAEFNRRQAEDSEEMAFDLFDFVQGVRFAERHHGITTPASAEPEGER